MTTLVLVGFLGGLVTGISPCVLPVLPVVFFSGGSPTGGAPRVLSAWRPYLVILGLVTSFSLVTLAGSLVLSALHLPQDVLRWAGLVTLTLVGIGLAVPWVGHQLEKPFSRLPQRYVSPDRGGFVLGLALGAVFVPCAGPVLAAITVAGATGRVTGETVALTLAFAVGTAIPLLVFALAGRGLAARVAAFRRRQRGLRVVAGVVMVGLAVGLVLDLPATLQRRLPDYTSTLQRALGEDEAPLPGGGSTSGPGALAGGAPAGSAAGSPTAAAPTQAGADPPAGAPSATPSADDASSTACVAEADHLVDCGAAPPLTGLTSWFNTPGEQPLTLAGLRGQVVLLDFWAYSCINCQRAAPHVEAWHRTYGSAGLQVIGLHAPEYAFERVPGNVRAGASRLGITYPVALDNDFATWQAYGNRYWPAEYLVDATGTVRHISFGEGGYATTEALIRSLLAEAAPAVALAPATRVADTAPVGGAPITPEIYLGAARAPAGDHGGAYAVGPGSFAEPTSQPEDTFTLDGSWQLADQSITPLGGTGLVKLTYAAQHVYLDVSGIGTLTVSDAAGEREVAVSGVPNIYDLAPAGLTDRSPRNLTVTVPRGVTAYSFTFG